MLTRDRALIGVSSIGFGRLGGMLPRTLVVLVSVLVPVAGLSACGEEAPLDQPTPVSEMAPTSTVAPPFDAELEPAEAVLAMVPGVGDHADRHRLRRDPESARACPT